MTSGIFWTVKLLRPELQHLVGDVAVEALGDGHHRDHRGDADEDAEHGEERAQLVRPQRGDGDAHGFREGHGRLTAYFRSSLSILPSRMWIMRWACSAMSRSWVTRMIVLPVAVQLLEQPHDLLAGGAVEVAGGLVGQQDRRAHHQRARDGHALALAARELVGLVVDAAAQVDQLQGAAAPARGAPPWGCRRRRAAARRCGAPRRAAAG